jgi:PhnB protein
MTASTHYPPLSPAFAVNDAERAIEFYIRAFGAIELYRLKDPDSGKIGHAEITIKGALVMLSDEYPAFNKTPKTLGGTTVKSPSFAMKLTPTTNARSMRVPSQPAR